MDTVEDVVIDEDGVFKYILIELTEKKKGGEGQSRTKLIVRGFGWAEFHADILDRVSAKFDQLGLSYECLGGGRISHDSQAKKINIYGYSVPVSHHNYGGQITGVRPVNKGHLCKAAKMAPRGFGQADHSKTKHIIGFKFDYPEANITWSNSGY